MSGEAGALSTTEPLALRIRDGVIAAATPAGAHAGRDPEVLGHPEAILVPGLIDSHLHLLASAAARVGIDLAAEPPGSIAALLRRVATAAGRAERGAWLRISGADESDLADRRPPSLAELDAAVPDRPLRIRHRTRHASWLNSHGLARLVASLGELSPEHLPRDASGAPLGVVYGLDQELTALVGPLSADLLDRGLRAVSRCLARAGVVAIDEVTGSNDALRVARIASAVAAGDVVQRVRVFLRDADELAPARRAAGRRVEIGGVKLFAHDADEVAAPAFAGAVERARRAGLPIAVHAVEADVTAAVLEVLARATPRRAPSRVPDRIEHASLCPPELARQLARRKVAVVTQPGFLRARGDKYRAEVEEPLWPWLYPLRTLGEAGVPVAAGSDAPVGPLDPRIGLAAATDRRSARGDVLASGEAIAPAAALALYTVAPRRLRGGDASSPWYAAGAPGELAILEPGADPARRGWSDLRAHTLIVGDRAANVAAEAE